MARRGILKVSSPSFRVNKGVRRQTKKAKVRFQPFSRSKADLRTDQFIFYDCSGNKNSAKNVRIKHAANKSGRRQDRRDNLSVNPRAQVGWDGPIFTYAADVTTVANSRANFDFAVGLSEDRIKRFCNLKIGILSLEDRAADKAIHAGDDDALARVRVKPDILPDIPNEWEERNQLRGEYLASAEARRIARCKLDE